MFSELIDEVVGLSKKANLRDSHMIGYLNATIRECQTKEWFYRDRVEDQFVSTTETSFVLDRPKRIRNIEAVSYPEIFDAPRYIPRKVPGRIKEDDFYYYYGGTTYFVFNGVAVGTLINMSYFQYSRVFKYYEDPTKRPAAFDFEAETWSYPLGATTDVEKEAARDLVWHWMFEDWREMLKQGLLAKTYKDVEDARAPAAYAMFQQQLKLFQASEPKERIEI